MKDIFPATKVCICVTDFHIILSMKENTKGNLSPFEVSLALAQQTFPFSEDILLGIFSYARRAGTWNFPMANGTTYLPDNLKRWKGDGIITDISTPELIK